MQNNKLYLSVLLIFTLLVVGCGNGDDTSNQDDSKPSCYSNPQSANTLAKPDGAFEAYKADAPIAIDACGNEPIWQKSDWYSMNYRWMGEAVDSTDYQGKFKVAWDSQYLYLLVEVIDEHLHPTLKDGKENYWKGDYVEVFIDEDQSGGIHQYNHQAFAYHISTEGHAIDKSTSQETIFFDDHIEVARSRVVNRHLWEIAIRIFDNQFDETAESNRPITLAKGKRMGFSIAYGDNDGKNSRENFMGSKQTHGQNNDEGYINADVFGSVLLVE